MIEDAAELRGQQEIPDLRMLKRITSIANSRDRSSGPRRRTDPDSTFPRVVRVNTLMIGRSNPRSRGHLAVDGIATP
jgi:hypothetical protein